MIGITSNGDLVTPEPKKHVAFPCGCWMGTPPETGWCDAHLDAVLRALAVRVGPAFRDELFSLIRSDDFAWHVAGYRRSP